MLSALFLLALAAGTCLLFVVIASLLHCFIGTLLLHCYYTLLGSPQKVTFTACWLLLQTVTGPCCVIVYTACVVFLVTCELLLVFEES